MNLERIASLLASGLKPSHVATIVGCSPARITQLSKDSPEFNSLLSIKISEMQEKDIEEQTLSTKYHAAEHILLEQVLAMAPVSELRDVTAALRVVAERQEKAKTRLNPIVASNPVLQQVIQINLPSHALPEIVLNKEKEVIAVNNTNLAPLSSTGVTNLFKQMRQDKNERNDNESQRILTAPEESIGEVISSQAKSFLESLHPAPFAEVF